MRKIRLVFFILVFSFFACHHAVRLRANYAECHVLQTSFYSGNYNDFNSPNVMKTADVKCTDCHIREGEKIIRPEKQDCLKCHNSNYENKIFLWQNHIKKNLGEIDSIIAKTTVSKLSDSLQNRIEQVNKIINDIKKDGSFGVHNYELMNGLLNDNKKFILENSK